jgi:hypothetical protein
MPLFDEERRQEIFLMIGDSWQGNNKRWLYGFVGVLILALPLYFTVKTVAYNVIGAKYEPPQVIGQVEQSPLEEMDKQIVRIQGNIYSAFVKLKNVNLDWGMANMIYRAEIKASDGTLITSITNETFVLPASEKLVILPRFTTDKTPSQIDFSILDSKFTLKQVLPAVNLDLQRTQISFLDNETIVSAVIKNNSPFFVTQVDLPVVLYNDRSQVVAVNYTNINDLKPSEIRSFQVSWPTRFGGTLISEVTPEINIFMKDIIKTQGSQSPFEEL